MHRFFADEIVDGIAQLSAEDSAHIAKTLRMSPGDCIIVGDGTGMDHTCRIESISGGLVCVQSIDCVPNEAEPDVCLCLYVAFPKSDKPEWIVQKAVELGAREICFFQSNRCVSRPNASAAEKRIARLSRVAYEAAKQSERGVVPAVTGIVSFEEAVSLASKADRPLFLYERGGVPIRDALNAAQYRSVSLMTGPEGGFEDGEVSYARDHGMQRISLGKRILRCETAPLCAAASVMFHSGNL